MDEPLTGSSHHGCGRARPAAAPGAPQGTGPRGAC